MGMSMHVVGFRKPDERWHKMKAVHDSCVMAGMEVPREVREFFGDAAPDSLGVRVDVPVSEWEDDMRQGYEVELSALPKNITHLRFYCSW